MIAHPTKPLRSLAAACLLILMIGTARADRVIISPSSTALLDGSGRAEFDRTFSSDDALSASSVNLGLPNFEAEATEFHRDHKDAITFSGQTQILPESEFFPSFSAGIRDIGNMSHAFGRGGYYGRGYYVVAGRTPVSYADAPFPFRNLTTTIGLGGGSIHGFFGSISSDFPLHTRATLEWDSRYVNTRLSLPITRYAQVQYSRMSGEDLIGLEVHHIASF